MCRMTRDDAEALCARNAAEHPDRKVAQWRPQEHPDGTWTVVRNERPPTPDDPRTAAMQNLGPHIGPAI